MGGYTMVSALGTGFNAPSGLAIDASGNVYVADTGNNRVVKLDSSDPPSLAFASTNDGSTSTDSPQTITVQNIGNAGLSFPAPASGNNPNIAANFGLSDATTCPVLANSSGAATLTAAASCLYLINFAPTTSGSISGSLVITDNSLNATSPYETQSIAMSGTGTAPSVTLSATSLTFLAQITGSTSAAQTVTLTNSGTASLSISSISVSGDFAEIQTCGSSVAAGAACTISVTFTPTAAGTRSGLLVITDSANGSPHTVALSGTGTTPVPSATLSANSLTFSSQTTGTTSALQNVLLTNSGQASLSITSIAATGDFARPKPAGVAWPQAPAVRSQ